MTQDSSYNNNSENYQVSCKVSCQFHSTTKRQFYVDENMQVWPCCFYAASKILGRLELEDPALAASLAEDQWNDLSKNKMEDIVNHPMYQENIFYKGWATEPSNLCMRQCGNHKPSKVKVTIA
jgi:hypothetical protein